MQNYALFLARRPAWLVGALVLILLGGGWWRWNAATQAPPAADGTRILLDLAGAALRDGRRVAPVGSNAFEFYFSVLQIDPHDSTALEELRKAFKPACDDVERSIVDGDLDEAQRELQLLRAYDAGNYQYDPAHFVTNASNYRLALLGGYLDAQRIRLGQEHAVQAMAMRAQLSASAAAP